MKNNLYKYCFMIMIFSSAILFAADDKSPSSYNLGAYNFSGGFSLDYRTNSISNLDGNSSVYATNRFNEQFGLTNGLKVSDFTLFGLKNKNESGLFDQISLNVSGVNDPFTNVGLRLKSNNSYEFKVNYSRAQYFYHRPDSLWADLHSFDMTRNILNTSLNLHLTNDMSLDLSYNGVGRSGNEIVTVSPYYYGVTSNDVAGKFANLGTGNIYWMNTPKNDWTNSIAGNLNYNLRDLKTVITVGGGTRSFKQDVTYNPINSTNGLSSLYYYAGTGFGTANATQTANSNGLIGGMAWNERMVHFDWHDNRSNSTSFFFGRFATTLLDGVTLNGEVRSESTTGTSENGGSQEGLARYTTFLKDTAKLQIYNATTVGTADLKFNRMLASFLLNIKITDELSFATSYKYQSDDETTTMGVTVNTKTDTTGVSTAGASSTRIDGSARTWVKPNTDVVSSKATYKSTMHTILPQFVYSPMSNLNIRLGASYIMKDPLYNIDTLYAPINTTKYLDNTNLSKGTKTLSPFFNLYYKPIDMLSLRARYEMTQNNSSYNASVMNYYQNNANGATKGAMYEGTAPQYDRITPEKKNTMSVGADIKVTDDLIVSIGYKATSSSSNLKGFYDFYNSQLSQSSPTATVASMTMTGDINYKSDISAMNASVRYMFAEGASLQVSAVLSANHWSIPFSSFSNLVDVNNSSTASIPQGTGAFYDNKTGLVDQDIKDTYIDATLCYPIMKDLKVSLGYSMTKSTGGTFYTPDNNQVKTTTAATNPTGLGIYNPRLDQPWVGGPYNQSQIHANIKYQFMPNLGVGVDFLNVKYEESKEMSFVSLSNWKGNMLKFSLIFKI